LVRHERNVCLAAMKKGLLFCKKEAKKFCLLRRAAGSISALLRKSFLVLFFKKELLASLSPEMAEGASLSRPTRLRPAARRPARSAAP
jgi:hypothetical protein